MVMEFECIYIGIIYIAIAQNGYGTHSCVTSHTPLHHMHPVQPIRVFPKLKPSVI